MVSSIRMRILWSDWTDAHADLSSRWMQMLCCYFCHVLTQKENMSHDMRFPTMWYVRPAKAQTSLRIRAV